MIVLWFIYYLVVCKKKNNSPPKVVIPSVLRRVLKHTHLWTSSTTITGKDKKDVTPATVFVQQCPFGQMRLKQSCLLTKHSVNTAHQHLI